jgi:hypothetical protein
MYIYILVCLGEEGNLWKYTFASKTMMVVVVVVVVVVVGGKRSTTEFFFFLELFCVSLCEFV